MGHCNAHSCSNKFPAPHHQCWAIDDFVPTMGLAHEVGWPEASFRVERDRPIYIYYMDKYSIAILLNTLFQIDLAIGCRWDLGILYNTHPGFNACDTLLLFHRNLNILRWYLGTMGLEPGLWHLDPQDSVSRKSIAYPRALATKQIKTYWNHVKSCWISKPTPKTIL